jgi:hypothetical protein
MRRINLLSWSEEIPEKSMECMMMVMMMMII